MGEVLLQKIIAMREPLQVKQALAI